MNIKNSILEDLQRIKIVLGKIPTQIDYRNLKTKKIGGMDSLLKEFGSWNNALLAAFGEVNIEIKGSSEVSCKQCDKLFKKRNSAISYTKNNFCSKICSNTYTNNNKTVGYSRSKLEAYLESKLKELYPTLELHFNRRDEIGSELDIYIPSLRLAFELNGPFHYEPIYSQEQLLRIQSNDTRKFAACQEAGIGLCVIDTSSQRYFKESSSKKYLDIIINIIQQQPHC